MNSAFIKTISSNKGAIGIIGIIVFLFIIAAVGASVYFVASATDSSSHAELIPQNSFLVYTATQSPELNKKWSDAIGKSNEEAQEDITKQLQGAAAFIDVEKFEKVISSLSDAEDAFGRVTFAMSNLNLDITKIKKTYRIPDMRTHKAPLDDETKKLLETDQEYESTHVKMHLDMMMIIEVKDEAKFKEVGKNLEFDMDTAEFKEHQGVKYFEIKMLNFEDIIKNIPNFEFVDCKVFACVFGRNLVVANGEANIKNIIDVQKGNAKSLEDNTVAEKRIDWSDEVFCSWINVNYLMNYFASLGDKNSDYKEFQQVYNAMKLSDIESVVTKSKVDFSDNFETKIYINSDNKYLKLLNEIPAVKSESLFGDLPKNSHITLAASMDKGVEVFEILMEELRKDLPEELTKGMPESFERKDFPENTYHLLQHIGSYINIDKELVSPDFVTFYKLAENTSEDEFSKFLKTEYMDYSTTGVFENHTFYSGMDPSKLESLKAQLKTPKLNTVVKKLDKDMHALCVIASPENLLKMFAEEIEAIDFTALKARKDYFVCGMIIEKDGILFTSDPMFDLAVAFSKYTQKIQEKMLSRQQTQMADSYWFEAGSNCNNIKQAVDVYKAKHSDDLSSLKDLLNEGFVKGSKLIKELGWLEGTFDYLQFFDRESFSLEFLTDGKDGHYIIKVDTSKGKGGPSGRGPKEGVGTYESKTDTWTGKLESYGKMMSQMPRYEEPPELPFPPKLPDTDIEKEKVPLTDLYMVFSYKNLDDRFELIIRTDVKLNETKLNQISDKYKELLQKKETAIITIGSEAEFNKWQKNGGKVKIIFTTKQNDKFDDYRTDSFVIVY